ARKRRTRVWRARGRDRLTEARFQIELGERLRGNRAAPGARVTAGLAGRRASRKRNARSAEFALQPVNFMNQLVSLAIFSQLLRSALQLGALGPLQFRHRGHGRGFALTELE